MLINTKQYPLRGKFTLWLLLLLSVGYPIQASIPIFLKLPSTPINATFRAAYLLIALYLIITVNTNNNKISKGGMALILFWILYSARMIFDMAFRGVTLGFMSNFYVCSFAFGSCFFPMLAVILNAKYIDIKGVFFTVFKLVVLSNAIILAIVIYQTGSLSMELFSTRMNIKAGEEEFVINTITIGLFGNYLFVISIYGLLMVKLKTIKMKFFVAFCVILGMFNVLLAASRGPLITMFLVVIFMFYYKYRTSVKKKISILKFVLIAAVSITFFTITGLLNNITDRFVLFNRIETLKDNLERGEKEERNYEYASALRQFYSSPIVGDRFTTRIDSTYPHNIYLEILMAMGLIGAIVFLKVHYEIYKRTRYLFKVKDDTLLFILAVLLIVFLSAMTSGGIALNPELWMFLSFFLCVNHKQIEQEKNNEIPTIT